MGQPTKYCIDSLKKTVLKGTLTPQNLAPLTPITKARFALQGMNWRKKKNFKHEGSSLLLVTLSQSLSLSLSISVDCYFFCSLTLSISVSIHLVRYWPNMALCNGLSWSNRASKKHDIHSCGGRFGSWVAVELGHFQTAHETTTATKLRPSSIPMWPPRSQSGNCRELTTSPPGHQWEAKLYSQWAPKYKQCKPTTVENTQTAKCNARKVRMDTV